MFPLTKVEFKNLRSQFVTSSSNYGGRRNVPYAFTEHGIAMLSSVLKSQRSVQMNILIIRSFVKMRDMLATNKSLAIKIEKIESEQKKQNSIIALLINEINKLNIPTKVNYKKQIGFKTS